MPTHALALRQGGRTGIGRRAFLSVLGGAAIAAPRRASAQRQLPVIGFLHAATVETYIDNAAGFADGLREAGFVEAQNVAIEYRFADGQPDQLAALAADLVARQVALIVVGGDARAAIAAKAATATVPIVFVLGCDPVALGLAASLPRPGANVTGVTFTTTGLMPKKLALLRELVPRAMSVGYLGEDPRTYVSEAALSRAIEEHRNELLAAAGALGWQVVVAEIGADRDYEAAFAIFAGRRPDVLVVAPSAVFANDSDDIVALTGRYDIPTIWPRRADVLAGGLMSYGARQSEAWRQAGIYAGQILKGPPATPADMPVIRSERLELVIGMAVAKSLGLTVPPNLLTLADEMIE
jgi:putative tryptophan/tyrosine transport system substrate-binding protein